MTYSISELRVPSWETSKSTFVHNMSLPVHGWYRFPAGFSAEWVESIIQNRRELLDGLGLLDPFAGVGTTVLAAEQGGVRAYGIEAQPFIARIAQTKLLWHTEGKQFFEVAQAILKEAQARQIPIPTYPALIRRCYTEEAIRDLHNLRWAWNGSLSSHPPAGGRLPKPALLAANILTYLAVVLQPLPISFWDRQPRRTPGRLRRVLVERSFPEDYIFDGRIREKASVMAHLPKGIAAHRSQKAA